MISKIIQARLRQIHHDLETVRILLEFGRQPEAIGVVLKAWDTMNSLENPPKTSDCVYAPGLRIPDLISKLRSWTAGPAEASAEGLREIHFDRLAEKLFEVAEKQLHYYENHY